MNAQEDEHTYAEELQAATLRELRSIRYRLGVVIVVLVAPAILVLLAFFLGVGVGLID